MFRILKHADGAGVTVKSLKTEQEVHFKEDDLLELQKEINLVYPPEELSPVVLTVQRTLLGIARDSLNDETRVIACNILLNMEAHKLAEQRERRIMQRHSRR